MHKWLVTYFGFNRKEFNGLMTLIVLIGLTMLLPYIYSIIKKVEPITEADQLAVMNLVLAEQQKISLKGKGSAQFKTVDKEKVRPFLFDPNTIDQAGWEQLGLSARQASAILRYIDKGGRFKKAQDLQKMYTINEATYNKLSPYVRIAGGQLADDDLQQEAYGNQTFEKRAFERRTFEKRTYDKNVYEKRIPVIVEINGADTAELNKIVGIGMTFANRIIKYRERIGGFCKKEQLMEVFGLDSVKYREIKDQVLVDAARIKKININIVSFDDLKNHPYLRYKQINALIQYRKQHGNYGNIADLNKVIILNQETIDRLAAYLEF